MVSVDHVVVLKGGISSEREVSLRSGAECAAALRTAGFDVTELDVTPETAPRLGLTLSELKPAAAFLALHGKYGEDGTIQGLLELLRIRYTHSGVLASALAMDKARAKTVMKAAGVPVPEGRVVDRLEAAKEHVLKRPYVLKPVDGGSSLGVFIVREDMEHPPQELWAKDWSYGEAMIAERFVPGMELTCAVMGDVALGVIEIIQDNRFYDYEAKYAEGGSRHILPARVQPKIYHEVQKLSLRAHLALGCRGVTRADFRYDDRLHGTGELVCLEVNTQPGMTRTSLVPELAAHAGHSFPELVRWMVEDASCDR
jgi:D-alanine-D-alanine ligase